MYDTVYFQTGLVPRINRAVLAVLLVRVFEMRFVQLKPLLKNFWSKVLDHDALWRLHICALYIVFLTCKNDPVNELDGCIVWNAHNTVFGSKCSAICAQAAYFLHSTMPSLTCLRLSDVSVICHAILTYSFQFRSAFLPRQSARRNSGVLDLPNIGHRTSPKIWGGFLYRAYIPEEWLWIDSNGKNGN